MTDFTQQLHDELLVKLEDLDKNDNPLIIGDPRPELISSAIDRIKEKLKNYQFEKTEEEIIYFKMVLPETISLCIYYTEKIEWDRIRRQGSPESLYRFKDRIYSQTENFRISHPDFHDYCVSGKTHLDQLYFLRSSPMNTQREYSFEFIINPNSPPIYSGMKARLIAFTRLERELNGNTSCSDTEATGLNHETASLPWLLPKICLTELIYALKEVGAFGEGKELTAIKTCFEKMFRINLGNISRTFQEILARKKGHTSFLDKLKECLLKKITDMEEANIPVPSRR